MMSGGHFDYAQFRILEIADEIDRVIANPPEWLDLSPETIIKFKEASLTLKKAETMSTRIDWLLSGDDGEETFHKRWIENMEKL